MLSEGLIACYFTHAYMEKQKASKYADSYLSAQWPYKFLLGTEDIEIDGTVSLQTEQCLVHCSSLPFGSSVPSCSKQVKVTQDYCELWLQFNY